MVDDDLPDSQLSKAARNARKDEESDTDFQPEDRQESADEADIDTDTADAAELLTDQPNTSLSGIAGSSRPSAPRTGPPSHQPQPTRVVNSTINGQQRSKLALVEICKLCGLAHYGIPGVCPHLNSEAQIALMREAVSNSQEPPHICEAALKCLDDAQRALKARKARNTKR